MSLLQFLNYKFLSLLTKRILKGGDGIFFLIKKLSVLLQLLCKFSCITIHHKIILHYFDKAYRWKWWFYQTTSNSWRKQTKFFQIQICLGQTNLSVMNSRSKVCFEFKKLFWVAFSSSLMKIQTSFTSFTLPMSFHHQSGDNPAARFLYSQVISRG